MISSSLLSQTDLLVGIKPRIKTGFAIELVAATIAFWPVWAWYCERMFDRSDEPLGLLALITLIALSFTKPNHGNGSEELAKSPFLFGTTIALLLIYCCFSFAMPHLVQSLIAISIVGLCLLRAGVSILPLAGSWTLLILCLPVVASLNFYLGYPLRFLATCLASIMLNLGGLAVRVEGACIVWNGRDVSIDQPCSGIRMLWVSFYLAATFATILRLRPRPTIYLLSAALASAVAANALRVSSLFYLESGIIEFGSPWHGFVHEGTGVISFVFAAAIISWSAFALSRSRKEVETLVTSKPMAGTSSTKLKAFVASCALAAVVPFFIKGTQPLAEPGTFRGWPNKFEGSPISEVKLAPDVQRFASQFQGRIGIFGNENRRLVFRWVTQPSRQLHASEDCYRASGYEIKWLPEYKDDQGNRWSSFQATKGLEKLLVRERLYDESGHSWTDVSAWYWSAVLQHTHGPWWSVCVVERINDK